jgi:hypothetical protein
MRSWTPYQSEISHEVGFLIVVIGLVVSWIAYRIWLERERVKAVRAMAEERSMEWRANLLPRDFPCEQMLNDLFHEHFFAEPWWGIDNEVVGDDGHDCLLAFDVKVRRGRAGVRQTIVARRFFQFQIKTKVTAGYRYRVLGAWQLVTRQPRTLPLANVLSAMEIERQWKLLR